MPFKFQVWLAEFRAELVEMELPGVSSHDAWHLYRSGLLPVEAAMAMEDCN